MTRWYRLRWWLCGLRGHDWDYSYVDDGEPMGVCRRCGRA